MSTVPDGKSPRSQAASVPPLEVKGVSKIYKVRGLGGGTFTAVDNVSFTIPPGAALSLVGASGSGKSTLAKIDHRLGAADFWNDQVWRRGGRAAER